MLQPASYSSEDRPVFSELPEHDPEKYHLEQVRANKNLREAAEAAKNLYMDCVTDYPLRVVPDGQQIFRALLESPEGAREVERQAAMMVAKKTSLTSGLKLYLWVIKNDTSVKEVEAATKENIFGGSGVYTVLHSYLDTTPYDAAANAAEEAFYEEPELCLEIFSSLFSKKQGFENANRLATKLAQEFSSVWQREGLKLFTQLAEHGYCSQEAIEAATLRIDYPFYSLELSAELLENGADIYETSKPMFMMSPENKARFKEKISKVQQAYNRALSKFSERASLHIGSILRRENTDTAIKEATDWMLSKDNEVAECGKRVFTYLLETERGRQSAIAIAAKMVTQPEYRIYFRGIEFFKLLLSKDIANIPACEFAKKNILDARGKFVFLPGDPKSALLSSSFKPSVYFNTCDGLAYDQTERAAQDILEAVIRNKKCIPEMQSFAEKIRQPGISTMNKISLRIFLALAKHGRSSDAAIQTAKKHTSSYPYLSVPLFTELVKLSPKAVPEATKALECLTKKPHFFCSDEALSNLKTALGKASTPREESKRVAAST